MALLQARRAAESKEGLVNLGASMSNLTRILTALKVLSWARGSDRRAVADILALMRQCKEKSMWKVQVGSFDG